MQARSENMGPPNLFSWEKQNMFPASCLSVIAFISFQKLSQKMDFLYREAVRLKTLRTLTCNILDHVELGEWGRERSKDVRILQQQAKADDFIQIT